MDIGSMFLILALLVLVALFVGRPLFDKDAVHVARQEDVQAKAIDHDRSSLLAERDRILNALQELDFDHALGKIPEEDYPEQRQRLVESGADVLRRLDAWQPQSAGVAAEARLEAAVAARRSDGARLQAAGVNGGSRKSAVAINGADDDLEKLLADRRRERREKSAGFCPQCGGPMQKSDRFCPKCGAKTS
jgi:rubrerythrin